MTHRIQRFSPAQAAKVLGILYAVLGLVLTPIFIVLSFADPESPGFTFALLFPILYGVIGVVSGAVGSMIYNLVARWIGGFEVELAPVVASQERPE